MLYKSIWAARVSALRKKVKNSRRSAKPII
jgi:hypothetical protein